MRPLLVLLADRLAICRGGLVRDSEFFEVSRRRAILYGCSLANVRHGRLLDAAFSERQDSFAQADTRLLGSRGLLQGVWRQPCEFPPATGPRRGVLAAGRIWPWKGGFQVFQDRDALGRCSASNIEFLTLSARATPDGLVTLFCTLSMLGFAMVWFGEGRGLAGAMLAGAAWGGPCRQKACSACARWERICCLCCWRGPRGCDSDCGALFDWRAGIAGVVIGTFWYVAMVRLHGTGALRDFFNHQVGAKGEP